MTGGNISQTPYLRRQAGMPDQTVEVRLGKKNDKRVEAASGQERRPEVTRLQTGFHGQRLQAPRGNANLTLAKSTHSVIVAFSVKKE